MLISLSGTPGVGKTTASLILKKRGHKIVDLNQLAEENEFVVGFDDKRGSKIIDVERLDDFICEHFTKEKTIIEGHLSHLLSVDIAIILRCDPIVLEERLKRKGWPEAKIKENVGAEILDVIKVEAFEVVDKVYEIDTTSKTPLEVAKVCENILEGIYEEPKINWLDKYEHLLF
ncbi:MAG: adenylate kinase family protein [Thermoplasmata archaeon]|nr:MAG: adenylate kinase family protein [Thermoplasmata archaeon]